MVSMELPRILLAAAVVVALVGASVLPVGHLPADPGNYLGHLSAYGAAMVALSGVARLRPWAVAVGLVGLGVVIEFIQPLFGRENHWQDMAANAVGVGTGWLALAVWSGRQKDPGGD
jgi:hypothetical protein